jgi:hypothetical protein
VTTRGNGPFGGFATAVCGRGGGDVLAEEGLAEEEGVELGTEADVHVGCGDGPELSGDY